MIVGYCRTSTVDQVAGLAAQERDLAGAGAERFFVEQVSSVANRTKLKECLAFLRDGDALMSPATSAVVANPPCPDAAH
jgi:DNA invertase Pin-like site-specific DNA recombinase